MIKKTGLTNPYKDTLNHYGTVDLGTMSHETPLSILIRKMAVSDAKIFRMVFKDIYKLPTLTQYNPEHFFFEEIQGNLLCSAFSGLPLVRYDLRDHGAVFTLKDIVSRFKNIGIDLFDEARKAHIADTIWNLPFVHVYERSDFSVSFFAFQIYPETIRKTIQEKIFEDTLTGKFTMTVNYDKKNNQYFEINVELMANKKPTNELKQKIIDRTMHQLLLENSEYRKTHEEYPDRVIPKIVFWPYEHPAYFKPGVKQKWVKK
ncbi:MAG: hypothetical protein HYT11_03585 [Candidatus Levybacteria bacterium]|nr:hypothetical protein [Candidatus Levybacteria bacterium]